MSGWSASTEDFRILVRDVDAFRAARVALLRLRNLDIRSGH
jgi:hypothetical protein